MSIEYIVRLYRRGDEEEIVQLLNIAFEGWPKFDLRCSPLEHWGWKYLDNPLRINFITVSELHNKIIGCDHSNPLKVKIGDSIFHCDYAADTAVHPNFRRMGVARSMIEHNNLLRKKTGVDLQYWVTSNPRFIDIYSRIRPRFPYTLTILVRIQDIDSQLRAMPMRNAWFKKQGFRAIKLINKVKNKLIYKKLSDCEVNISLIKHFDKRIDSFWDEISSHYRFIMVRRSEYLNWRFCDPRAGDYIIKQAEDDEGHILGFIIMRINRYLREYPVGYIVDLLTIPNHIHIADALVEDALDYFDGQNINIVSCLIVKNHTYEQAFKRHGFVDSRISPHLFYNTMGSKIDLRGFPVNKVHFSYGDIDSLPVSVSRASL